MDSRLLIRSSLKVSLNGCESTAGTINAGVLQGSILGPTLFLIFINDLAKNLVCDVDMFADDTTISMMIPYVKSRGSVAHCINSDLKEIESWDDNWIVKFNAKKTSYLKSVVKLQRTTLKLVF